MAGGSSKAIIAAFFANLGIAIAKLVGFVFTGSASMLAEAVHSGADTGNQALLLLGGKRAQKTATEQHQFGFGRERYFWAFVVALVLFSLGAGFATFEGISKIRNPHELEGLWWAVGILIFAILLEGRSFRVAIQESNKVRGAASWSTFIRRSRSPELPVVLLEDFGAIIGLFIALAAVLISEITNNPIWDGIGTLAIGILLGIIAIVLAIEMKSLLIGEGATRDHYDKICSAILGTDHVQSIINIRTLHLGPDELLVAAKVDFNAGLSVPQVADVIDSAEKAIRHAVPIARLVYLEPDLYEADHVARVDHAPEGEAPHKNQ